MKKLLLLVDIEGKLDNASVMSPLTPPPPLFTLKEAGDLKTFMENILPGQTECISENYVYRQNLVISLADCDTAMQVVPKSI